MSCAIIPLYLQVQSSSASCSYPASAAVVPAALRPVLETVATTFRTSASAVIAVKSSGVAVAVSVACSVV